MSISSCDIGGINSFRVFNELAGASDIVHFHYPWPFGDLLGMCLAKEKPTVLTYHADIVKNGLLTKIYEPLMRRTLTKVSSIVATSPNYAQSSAVLSEKEYKKKLEIIPLCIHENLYAAPGSVKTLKKYGLEVTDRYCLFIGVLRKYKGLEYLIEASRMLDGKVVIAGDSPVGHDLRAKCDSLRLNNVIFTGKVTEKEKLTLLNNCCAVVLPSHLRSEAFGVCLLEGAMYSKPLITCEIESGMSFVNINGETGFVVAPENPTELAQKMNFFLKNKEASSFMGSKAYERYGRLFSGVQAGNQYLRLYQKIA